MNIATSQVVASAIKPSLPIAGAVLAVSVLTDSPGAWPYGVHATIPLFSKTLTTSPRFEFRKIVQTLLCDSIDHQVIFPGKPICVGLGPGRDPTARLQYIYLVRVKAS
jgi:hypothetical protein